MGMHISHGFDGPLKLWAFNTMRKELAKAAGLPPLELMEGYLDEEDILVRTRSHWLTKNPTDPEPGKPFGYKLSDRNMVIPVDGNLPISWKHFESDPICILLRIDDEAAEIGPSDCVKIADRIDELAGLLPEGTKSFPVQQDVIDLASAMRRAADSNEALTWR